MKKLINSIKRLLEDARRKCPGCGSRHIGKYLYGFPTADAPLLEKIIAGSIVLGGCTEINGPDFHCHHCRFDWSWPEF